MNTSSQPEEKPHRSGARYEKCRECGRDWNVSRGAEIPKSGYLCPKCWSKYIYQNTDSNKGAKK